MITVRLRTEITTPTGEVVQSFPIGPGELVIPSIAQILSASIKEVDVNGKSNQMKAVINSNSRTGIQLCLYGASNDLADSTLITLTVDIVQKPG